MLYLECQSLSIYIRKTNNNNVTLNHLHYYTLKLQLAQIHCHLTANSTDVKVLPPYHENNIYNQIFSFSEKLGLNIQALSMKMRVYAIFLHILSTMREHMGSDSVYHAVSSTYVTQKGHQIISTLYFIP